MVGLCLETRKGLWCGFRHLYSRLAQVQRGIGGCGRRPREVTTCMPLGMASTLRTAEAKIISRLTTQRAWLSVSILLHGSGSEGRWWQRNPQADSTKYLWRTGDYYVGGAGKVCAYSADSANSVAFGSGSAGIWWRRTPSISNDKNFLMVNDSGAANHMITNYHYASCNHRVAFGFSYFI